MARALRRENEQRDSKRNDPAKIVLVWKLTPMLIGGHRMPTYEFRCEKCDKTFEQVWSLSDYDKRIKEQNKCPSCGSTRVVKTISVVQVKTSKKS
jgi:putative FmdB family regulatory protein